MHPAYFLRWCELEAVFTALKTYKANHPPHTEKPSLSKRTFVLLTYWTASHGVVNAKIMTFCLISLSKFETPHKNLVKSMTGNPQLHGVNCIDASLSKQTFSILLIRKMMNKNIQRKQN